MREQRMSRLPVLAWLVMTCLASGSVLAQSLDEVLDIRSGTTEAGRQSQLRVDQLSDETRDLLTEFKQVMKVVDGLRVYNRQQERLIEQQERELAELRESIDQVTVIERQITPLMERMVDGLEKFIELDIPFLLGERLERIDFLREIMNRADVSVSEKFSQVMQAYQIENQYGSTIEAYTDEIPIDGSPRAVDVLKFGRVVLAYQTGDGSETGVWNSQTRSWEPLGGGFHAPVRDGLRMARQTMTPDLVNLPVAAPEAVR